MDLKKEPQHLKDLKIYFKGKQPEAVTGYSILGWDYNKKKMFIREHNIQYLQNFSLPSQN